MLQSGIKASMAIRIYGDSLEGLAEASFAVADQLRAIPQVNAATVNPDIVLGKPCELALLLRRKFDFFWVDGHIAILPRSAGMSQPSKGIGMIRSARASQALQCGRTGIRWSSWFSVFTLSVVSAVRRVLRHR